MELSSRFSLLPLSTSCVCLGHKKTLIKCARASQVVHCECFSFMPIPSGMHCHASLPSSTNFRQSNQLTENKNKMKANTSTDTNNTLQIQINRSISAMLMFSRFYDYYINLLPHSDLAMCLHPWSLTLPLKCHKKKVNSNKKRAVAGFC